MSSLLESLMSATKLPTDVLAGPPAPATLASRYGAALNAAKQHLTIAFQGNAFRGAVMCLFYDDPLMAERVKAGDIQDRALHLELQHSLTELERAWQAGLSKVRRQLELIFAEALKDAPQVPAGKELATENTEQEIKNGTPSESSVLSVAKTEN